jgi:hypothetical protein
MVGLVGFEPAPAFCGRFVLRHVGSFQQPFYVCNHRKSILSLTKPRTASAHSDQSYAEAGTGQQQPRHCGFWDGREVEAQLVTLRRYAEGAALEIVEKTDGAHDHGRRVETKNTSSRSGQGEAVRLARIEVRQQRGMVRRIERDEVDGETRVLGRPRRQGQSPADRKEIRSVTRGGVGAVDLEIVVAAGAEGHASQAGGAGTVPR